ncbi:hypothetical protein GJ698_28875 [Pseudoduganella sp. FT26W]|uniref:Uncharacterized protein n=1 Tax=Duganella aquatilis TaxID=2666082 RepID=A0A844D4S7_9BURK|nr:hypothetical protein [Duganella aquatilis]MRW88097.1 hypothetical protein [Duganella aquatilis]
MLITDELADTALKRLSNETGISSHLFRYEIQDDFQLLFISVAADNLTNAELDAEMPRIAAILKELMPVRENDYAWTVGFLRESEVVESCFGGNLAIPDWNGEQFVE